MEVKRTITNRQQRRHRTRSVIRGTSERPRLSVNISNYHVSAQLIDDTTGKTIASSTTIGAKTKLPSNLSERAIWVGEEIAKTAKKVNINRVVFDRGSKLYHGRVAKLADAARNAGLEF